MRRTQTLSRSPMTRPFPDVQCLTVLSLAARGLGGFIVISLLGLTLNSSANGGENPTTGFFDPARFTDSARSPAAPGRQLDRLSQESAQGEAAQEDPAEEGNAGEQAAPEDPTKKEPTRSAFHRTVDAYLIALDRSFVAHATRDEFGISARLYPDAWLYEILTRVQVRLERGESPEQIASNLRPKLKSLEKLKNRAGLRIDLTHTRVESDAGGVSADTIHIFGANLRKAFDVRLKRSRIQWNAWKPPTHLEPARIQVAQHYITRNRQSVPMIRDYEPKGPRAVFRGKTATVWGILRLKKSKKRPSDLSVQLKYDEYRGIYDDRHLLDLNEPENHLRRELEIVARRPGPWVIPTLPAEVEGFLNQLSAPPAEPDQ